MRGGREVAPVAVEKEDAAEAMGEQAAGGLLNDLSVKPGPQADGAAKIHVVVRGPQPEGRQGQNARTKPRIDSLGEGAHLQGIDAYRQVGAVLFAGAEGDDDRQFPVTGLQGGTGEFVPFHVESWAGGVGRIRIEY